MPYTKSRQLVSRIMAAPNKHKMKILVGLSGGVDSAVTAFLLKEQGHDVAGATMSIQDQSLKLSSKANSCISGDEKAQHEEIAKIADYLQIPFHIVDCRDEYKKQVLNNFRQEYLSGRTPNPCVRCNSFIKFGALLRECETQGIEFDKFATGHYARIVKPGTDHASTRYAIQIAADTQKEQSYFLYRLSQEQLAKLMFPLGGLTKAEVREIARRAGLFVSEKKESQDFCENYSELLGIADRKGNIVNTSGKVLGEHNGFWHFTVGQRRGLSIAAERPLYVIRIDSQSNEVVVGYDNEALTDSFAVTDIVSGLLDVQSMKSGEEQEMMVRVRSSQELKKCTIRVAQSTIPHNPSTEIICKLHEPQRAISPGQSAVFYRDNCILFGGVIA